MVGVDETLKQLAEEIITKAQQKLREKNTQRRKEIEREIGSIYRRMMKGDRNMKGLISIIKDTELKEIDLEMFLEPNGFCEAIAAGIDFKPTQLRKLFHELRKLQYQRDQSIRLNLLKLIPYLAYAKGRELIDDEFYSFSKELILKVENQEDFKIFVDIFEAIVAYHRYYNPKES